MINSAKLWSFHHAKIRALALPFMDGMSSPSGFFGHDPVFLRWVHDLFLYYWDQAKR